MKVILQFSLRNLRLYFRDKTGVFFSLLSVFIIIGLYALFLGQVQVNGIKASVGDIKGIRFLVDSWIMSGLIAINTITVTLGALGSMVKDENDKIMRDFVVAPIKRSQIVASYVLSSMIVGIIMTFVALILGEIYIKLSGGELLPFITLIKVLGLIILNVFSSAAFVFLLVSFIKSETAYATLSTIVGTLIGFVAGIYVPVGVMPDAVQTFIKFFPITYAASMFRQVFVEEPMKVVFKGAPDRVITEYRLENGIDFKIGSSIVSFQTMLLIVLGFGIVIFAISIFRTARRKRS